MKAQGVIFPDKLKVEFGAIDVPEPGPRDIVVRTKFSWISNGTEGSFLRGERINGEVPYREGDPWPFPISMGYQSTGIVESVGAEVTDLKPGQWVFGTIGHAKGLFMPFAGHISPKVMDRGQVWALPETAAPGINLPVAASGLVLTQVGYNCGARPAVEIGDVALVIGDGMVGQWAAQTLHWRGARVILAGKHDERLGLFGSGGGRELLNIKRETLTDGIKRLAPDGLNIVVDTVGTVRALNECIPLMRLNGHLVSAGYNGLESMIDLQALRFKELTVHSPSGWQPRRMEETLALVAAGHLRTEHLITHRMPPQQAPRAWDLILGRKEKVLGVVLEWD